MSVLVVGSIAYDAVETQFAKVDQALGGSATYFSAAASFFAPVRIVAVVGTDFDMGELEFLARKNVDLSGIMVEDGRTFRWGGRYEFDLNTRRTLYTHLNVFENFMPRLPERYRDSDYLFLANIQPELQSYVIEQVRRPKLVVLDTMNYWIQNALDDLLNTLKKINVLIINDSEARQLSDEPNLLRAARVIKKMGPQLIVVKKGEHGAMMFGPDYCFWAPAYPLERISDPTGAGDTFAGGFVGYLARAGSTSEHSYHRAIVYGSVLASYCVEEFSVDRLKKLSLEEIEGRYAEFKKMTHFETGV